MPSIIIGGIIPDTDIEKLKDLGVSEVYLPGEEKSRLDNLKNLGKNWKLRDIQSPDLAYKLFDSHRKYKSFLGWFISQIIDEKRIDFRSSFFDQYPNKNCLTVGVTGFANVGKSVLIDKLIKNFRELNKKVGVISVDPSNKTGRSRLGGDRCHMLRHIDDDNVFIYSMASRKSYGGIAEMTPQVIKIMRASNYEIIIVETIGVGQNQTSIGDAVDKVVLVLPPDLGLEQVYKSDLMNNIANIYVVNKADIFNPELTCQNIRGMLDEKYDAKNPNRPKIFKTAANDLDDKEIKAIAKEILG